MLNDNLGEYFEDERLVVFFGKRATDLEAMRRKFQSLKWSRLSQVHSSVAVRVQEPNMSDPPKADAHFTAQKKLGLVIATADCLPVMIDTGYEIAAIHAGWRGVAGKIIGETLSQMRVPTAEEARIANQKGREKFFGKDAFVVQEDTSPRAWIGPHIAFENFEVGLDVAEQLLLSFPTGDAGSNVDADLAQNLLRAHKDPNKRYVNLKNIAIAQLMAAGLSRDHIEVSSTDTVSSLAHASFRRDKAIDRQFSFIAYK